MLLSSTAGSQSGLVVCRSSLVCISSVSGSHRAAVSCAVSCAPLKAVRQPLSLPHSLSFPDSPRHNARDTAVKITGLLHGNTEEEEEEEAGLVGREAETRSPASAVGRPTAAVDVELSELGSRSLLTHTGIVYTGWWQGVCVCVWRGVLYPVWLRPGQNRSPHCDCRTSDSFSKKHMAPSVLHVGRCYKSLTEAPSRWEGGAAAASSSSLLPPLACSIRESLFMMMTMMMTISLCLHSLCYLNPSLSCLVPPLPPPPPLPLSPRCLSRVLLIVLLSCSRLLSQRVRVKLCIPEDLSGEEKQGECERLPL